MASDCLRLICSDAKRWCCRQRQPTSFPRHLRTQRLNSTAQVLALYSVVTPPSFSLPARRSPAFLLAAPTLLLLTGSAIARRCCAAGEAYPAVFEDQGPMVPRRHARRSCVRCTRLCPITHTASGALHLPGFGCRLRSAHEIAFYSHMLNTPDERFLASYSTSPLHESDRCAWRAAMQVGSSVVRLSRTKA